MKKAGFIMSRLQLALNVDDLDAAIDFYSRMFASTPAVRKPGYANFAIENPPLKLVLNEKLGADGSINHLGVEVQTKEEVSEAEARLVAEGLDTTGVAETLCCYAEKTETWLTAPDGNRWEWYVRTGDADNFANVLVSGDNACCAPDAEADADAAVGAPTGPTCC